MGGRRGQFILPDDFVVLLASLMIHQCFKDEVEPAHLFVSPRLLFRRVFIGVKDLCDFLERALDLCGTCVPFHTKFVVKGLYASHEMSVIIINSRR